MKKSFLLVVIGLMIISSSLRGQTNLTAHFSETPPTIDGVIGGTEWQDAQTYNLTFHSNVDQTTVNAPVYLLNDGTFLYCASTVPFSSSSTAYFGIYIDGDHSHSINGTMSEPHIDLGYNKAGTNSPLYPIYDAYWAEVPPCGVVQSDAVTPPSGAEHAFSGTSEISYEFKMPLADMTASPGETVGIHLMFSPGGVGYMYPSADYCDVASWPDLYITPGGQQGANILVYATSETTVGYYASSFDEELPAILAEEGFAATVTDRMETPVITSALLDGYDQLWLMSTDPYSGSGCFSNDEINAIIDFRNADKGILIMADDGPPGHSFVGDANQISTQLGVIFGGQYNYGPYAQPFEPDFSPHPLFAGVQTIVCTGEAAILSVSGSAEVAATHGGNNMISVLDDGQGRVVFDVSFVRFWDADARSGYLQHITVGNTPQYVKNIANWLSGVAQQPWTGVIYGYVNTTGLEPIPGVKVEVYSLGVFLADLTTGSDGMYSFDGLQEGTFLLKFSCDGFYNTESAISLTTINSPYDNPIFLNSIPPPHLIIMPNEYDMTYDDNGGIRIYNDGSQPLVWKINEENIPSWLIFSGETNGSLDPNYEVYIPFYVTKNGLPSDLYWKHINVESNGGTEEVLIFFSNVDDTPIKLSNWMLFPFERQGFIMGGEVVEGAGIKYRIKGPTYVDHINTPYHFEIEIEAGDGFTVNIDDWECHHIPKWIWCLGHSQLLIYFNSNSVEIGNGLITFKNGNTVLAENAADAIDAVSGLPMIVSGPAGVMTVKSLATTALGYIYTSLNKAAIYVADNALNGNFSLASLFSLNHGGEVGLLHAPFEAYEGQQAIAKAEKIIISFDASFSSYGKQDISFIFDIRGIENILCLGTLPGPPLYENCGPELKRQVDLEVNVSADCAMGVGVLCPVQVEIKDPIGRILNKEGSTIPNSEYYWFDINGDLSNDELAIIWQPILGQYDINVTPAENAMPNDSFSVIVYLEDERFDLANNLHISELTEMPFRIWTSEYSKIIGIVYDSLGGTEGACVDIYDDNGNLIDSYATDEYGHYQSDSIPNGLYSVSLGTPVGYELEQEIQVIELNHVPMSANFPLSRMNITPTQRGRGYWMHQVNALLSGKGKPHETYEDMCEYMKLIRTHFNEHGLNPVNVFEVVLTDDCNQRLEALRATISPKTKTTMNEKARAHLTALLLNMVSGKIAQWHHMSEDGATVSQAIIFCNSLITDSDADNDELSKEIAEMINEGQMVPADWISLATPDIAYRHTSGQALPTEFSLHQNYPNPFNPVTKFNFDLPHVCEVKLEIFNVLGQRVATLADGKFEAGSYEISWDAGNMASGIYLYRLTAGEFVETRQMTLLK